MGTMYANDTAFYTLPQREPWHGSESTIINEALSAKEALTKAGMDWTVQRAPVHTYVNGEAVTIPERIATVRSDTGQVLSVVGSNYRVVQNAEAFGFIDEVLGGPDLRFTAGGTMYGGRRVWLQATLDRDLFIGGDKDEKVEPYIVFATSHDGSLGVSCWITPMRLACYNALTWNMRSAKRSWKARHTRNVMNRAAEARMVLGLASRYFDDLQEIGDRLITTHVSDWMMNRLVERLMPMPDGKRTDEVDDGRAKTLILNRRESVMDCLKVDNLANVKNTAWGFVQAVADWDDHHRTARSEDLRADRIVFGDNGYKERSLALARELVGASN